MKNKIEKTNAMRILEFSGVDYTEKTLDIFDSRNFRIEYSFYGYYAKRLQLIKV